MMCLEKSRDCFRLYAHQQRQKAPKRSFFAYDYSSVALLASLLLAWVPSSDEVPDEWSELEELVREERLELDELDESLDSDELESGT